MGEGRAQAPYQREQGGFARARSHGFDGVEGLHAEEILGYVREVFSALKFFENIFGTSASENHKCARKREEKKRREKEKRRERRVGTRPVLQYCKKITGAAAGGCGGGEGGGVPWQLCTHCV